MAMVTAGAEQRLQPAADLDHLRQPEPVPRRDGDRPAVRAGPRGAGPDPVDRPPAARGCRCRRSPARSAAWRRIACSHRGQFAAENIGYSIAPGYSADEANRRSEQRGGAGRPADRGAGPAGRHRGALRRRSKAQPLMILGALLVVYIVLGVLYESYIHPLTILSTLPSAGVGALLAIQADRRAVQPDLAARAVPADRRREEERHPDDRPGAAAGARGRAEPGGVDPPRLPAALSADPDDHPGGDPRRAAAAARQRRRVRKCASRWAWPSSAGCSSARC